MYTTIIQRLLAIFLHFLMIDYSTSWYLNMCNMLLRSEGRGRTKRVVNVNSIVSENNGKNERLFQMDA